MTNLTENVKTITSFIISNATALQEFKPEPKRNRFGIPTRIYCVDIIPSNYRTELIQTLYFTNDRQGFFVSNEGNIVNHASNIEAWDIGDVEFTDSSMENHGTIGNRFAINVDGDIQIYKVYGFDGSNGASDIYFDVK